MINGPFCRKKETPSIKLGVMGGFNVKITAGK
jgi:hypothetical protein